MTPLKKSLNHSIPLYLIYEGPSEDSQAEGYWFFFINSRNQGFLKNFSHPILANMFLITGMGEGRRGRGSQAKPGRSDRGWDLC